MPSWHFPWLLRALQAAKGVLELQDSAREGAGSLGCAGPILWVVQVQAGML